MGEHWTVVFHVSNHYLPRGWSIGERKEGGGGGEKKNTPARSHRNSVRGRTEFLIGVV